jgi:hypothetical protein
MSDPLEKNYHRINRILSVTIACLLATVGGVWLYQNKNVMVDKKGQWKSPMAWVQEQVQKNEGVGLPKMEPIKGLNFDASKINWQTGLNGDQFKQLQSDLNKYKYQPPPYRPPAYQPPPMPHIPTGPRFGR